MYSNFYREYGTKTKDPNIEKAIQAAAQRTGLGLTVGREAVEHLFSWQRNSMVNAEYAEYRWSGFGYFRFFNDKRNLYKKKNPVADKYVALKTFGDTNAFLAPDRNKGLDLLRAETPPELEVVIQRIMSYPTCNALFLKKCRRKYGVFGLHKYQGDTDHGQGQWYEAKIRSKSAEALVDALELIEKHGLHKDSLKHEVEEAVKCRPKRRSGRARRLPDNADTTAGDQGLTGSDRSVQQSGCLSDRSVLQDPVVDRHQDDRSSV